MSQLTAGQRLGPYEVSELIGTGGMGEVYRALDTRLDREVAIKVLRAHDAAPDAQRVRRLEREAHAIARLDHPNLLTLFDVGHVDGSLFLVTELLRGESLRGRLDRLGALAADEVARIGEQIALGLAAAHAHGFVHRDLKPDNVFLTIDDRVKILDFGLALHPADPGVQSLESASTLDRTLEGTVLGTAPYLSPEQARGERPDARSDLFALGVLLVECSTGVSPFRRGSFAETLAAVLQAPAPSLAGHPGSGTLAAIVERCLAKDPADRPTSAAEVAAALRHPPVRREARRGEGRSLAVLPFRDMSPSGDQGYFCEGMAEEILHALARVDGLHVAARSSAFQLATGGHDLRDVGARLAVDCILEGSVRRAGDRLRVTVQLVDVESGYQLWSERYDRGVEDVFVIQDEVAASVAGALSGVLSAGARDALRRRLTVDLVAYEHYLRGRQLSLEYRGRSWRAAVGEFERALARDRQFAAAWAGLAEVYSHLYLWLGHHSADLEAAQLASERALELDPQGVDSSIAHGQVLLLQERLEESEASFRAALEQAPDHVLGLFLFGRLRFSQGRMAEAAELFERAGEADPADYQSLSLCVMAYEALGDGERQIDCARRAVTRVEQRLEIVPADARALYLGGIDRIHLGERERALQWLRRAREIDPDEPSTIYNVACGLARLGQHEEALAALAGLAEDGVAYRAWLEHDTDLDPLRGDARFQALLAKLP